MLELNKEANSGKYEEAVRYEIFYLINHLLDINTKDFQTEYCINSDEDIKNMVKKLDEVVFTTRLDLRTKAAFRKYGEFNKVSIELND